MFHHFHNKNHYKSQGSISKEDLVEIIAHLVKTYNVIDAHDYKENYMLGTLGEKEISLSFDDGLLCQYDVALEVLDQFNIKAFWFIPSEPIQERHGILEIYRHFRSVYFNDIDDFYNVFFHKVKKFEIDLKIERIVFEEVNHLCEYKFYSLNDRFFRYLRDKSLGEKKYREVMNALFVDYGCDPKAVSGQIWMNNDHLLDLDQRDHVIGAHSYHHPTNLAGLTKEHQFKEYKMNIDHLEKTINKKIDVMAHPCNSYNNDTLDILKFFNLRMGFRSNNKLKHFTNLEIPRIDYTDILLGAKNDR